MTILSNQLLLALPGERGFSYLMLEKNARIVGMGGNFVAIADDVNTINRNPAGLGYIENLEVAVSHLEWVAGIRNESIYCAIPVKGLGVIGAGIDYLWTRMEGNRDSPDEGTSFTAGNLVAQVLCGRHVMDNLAAGLTVKFISESVSYGSLSSFAIGGDIGVLIKDVFCDNLSFGFVMRNIGREIAPLYMVEEKMPLTFSTGVSYEFKNGLILATDANFTPSDSISFGSGLEFTCGQGSEWAFKLRTGYMSTTGNIEEWGCISGLHGGIGLCKKGFQVDYAIRGFGNTGGLTHYITLSWREGLSPKTPDIKNVIPME